MTTVLCLSLCQTDRSDRWCFYHSTEAELLRNFSGTDLWTVERGEEIKNIPTLVLTHLIQLSNDQILVKVGAHLTPKPLQSTNQSKLFIHSVIVFMKPCTVRVNQRKHQLCTGARVGLSSHSNVFFCLRKYDMKYNWWRFC